MKYSIQLLNCQHDCTYHLLWRLETFVLTADIFAKDSIMSDDILVFPIVLCKSFCRQLTELTQTHHQCSLFLFNVLAKACLQSFVWTVVISQL